MHKCVRCGRLAQSLEEINQGCDCGSKVFVFNKSSAEAVQEEAVQQGMPQSPAPVQLAEKKEESDGKAPHSYFARMAFTTEDVENIKILTEGVFMVDVNALSKNPVVLKDEEGVYYVKIPLGNGKKKQSDV